MAKKKSSKVKKISSRAGSTGFLKQGLGFKREKLGILQSKLSDKYKKKKTDDLNKRVKISTQQESIRNSERELKERTIRGNTKRIALDLARKLVEGKVQSKKILRKGPRSVLDLRDRPEREIPVEQHGFKEEQIGYGKLL